MRRRKKRSGRREEGEGGGGERGGQQRQKVENRAAFQVCCFRNLMTFTQTAELQILKGDDDAYDEEEEQAMGLNNASNICTTEFFFQSDTPL